MIRLSRFALLASLPILLALGRPALAEDPPPPDAPKPPDQKPAEDEAPDTTRGYIGYTPAIISTLKTEEKKDLGITQEHGFVVRGVIPRSPAEKAGLKAGDYLVKINGEAMPDTKAIDPKNDEQLKKFWKETWSVRVKKTKPGDVVTMEVERAGKKVEIKATAITWEAHDALVKLAEEDAMSVQVPDPADAGAPAAATFDFEKVPDGEVKPEGFLTMDGIWEVFTEKEKPENHVLRQYGSAGGTRTICVVTGKGHAYADGVAKVRFQCLDGMDGVGGGIVIRMKDRKNYLVLRADGVAKNLRIYAVRESKESVLATTDIPSPKLKTWLTLEVTFKGANVKAVLDGKATVEATDEAPGAGWCGLTAEADAETQFDDLKVEPTTPGAGK